MAPQIAYRQSQAALESDAAARRQTQSDDIASGYPRLVEKAVVRGSWFVKKETVACATVSF